MLCEVCAVCGHAPNGYFTWLGEMGEVGPAPRCIVCMWCFVNRPIVYIKGNDGVMRLCHEPGLGTCIRVRVRVRGWGILPPYGLQRPLWTRIEHRDDGTFALEVL